MKVFQASLIFVIEAIAYPRGALLRAGSKLYSQILYQDPILYSFYIRNILMFVTSQSVCGKPFQPTLMFVVKARSLPKSAAPERCLL